MSLDVAHLWIISANKYNKSFHLFCLVYALKYTSKAPLLNYKILKGEIYMCESDISI